MKVAIDGDTLAYKACFAVEYNTYQLEDEGLVFRYKKDTDGYLALNFDGDEYPDVVKVKVVEPVEHAYHLVNVMLESIRNELKSNSLTIYLSGPGSTNFRYMVPYPVKYKGGRPDKPVHLESVRKYMVDRFSACVTDGFEADDALGIFASTHKDAVIAAVDKDLKQVPGKHYNLDHKKLTIVDEVEGLRSFYRQMLMGDRTDNIIGIDGIGPKTAEKLIDKLYTQSDMEKVVKEKYKEFFKEDAQQMFKSNYDLLYVLRSDEEYKEVKNYYDACERETERQKFTEVGEGQVNSIGGLT